ISHRGADMEYIATPADDGSHTPPPDAPHNWQESFFFSWYDPQSRSGGYHHIDLQYFKRRACVWSWIAARGRVVSRFQSLNLPWPEGDLSDITVGPISIRTLQPLASYAIEVVHPEAPCGSRFSRESVTFTAFTDPLYLAMDIEGKP